MQHPEQHPEYLPVYHHQEDIDHDILPGPEPHMPLPETELIRDESQFQEMLNLLYAGRGLILASFLIVFVGTVIYTYTRVPVYKADSLVLLDNRLAPDLKDALEAAPNSRGSSSRSLDTEVYVLQRSLGVARQVSERLYDLQQDASVPAAFGLMSYGLSVDDLANVIQDRITVSREYVEDVLRISARSFDPGEARMLADFYAEEFVGYALGRSRSRIAATRIFLENEADERHRELKALEAKMEQFLDQNQGMTLSIGTETLVSQVAELEGLRDDVLLEIRMKEVLRDELRKEIKKIEPQLSKHVATNAPAKIALLQDQIVEVENALNLIYRQNPGLRGSPEALQDPLIKNYHGEISSLRNELAALTDQYIQEVVSLGGGAMESPEHALLEFGNLRRQLADEELDISKLGARIEVVNKHLATFQAQLKGLPAQTTTLTQLERSIRTTERAYLLLKEKLEDVRISEESEQGYAEIIRKADIPFKPESPNKPQNLMLGGLLGLLLGLGLAVLKQQMYRNIVVTPEDLSRQNFPLLGVVPSMNGFIKDQFKGVRLVEHNGYLNDSCLISLQTSASFVADAYRRIRFNIHGLYGEEGARSVLVTSPNPGEGKSITALNLAIASAQAGLKTIVVDTDLRRPSIHEKIGLESEPGFVEMIRARRLRFRKAITHVENLYVLTAGKPAENSAEVMSSKEMPIFVQELKRHFDMVILDSPPFMLVSDPLVLSTFCDGTVLVASAGQTKLEELHQGVQEFQNVGGRVMGVILNNFDPGVLPGSKNKYKYYRYASQYSYEQSADALLPS